MIYRGTIDLSIQPNRLTGHDRLEGLSADIVPEYAFSTGRVLIADQEALEVGLVELCRTLLAARWRLFAYPRARIAHVSQPLTPVERAALRAGLLNAGFSQALFPEPRRRLPGSPADDCYRAATAWRRPVSQQRECGNRAAA